MSSAALVQSCMSKDVSASRMQSFISKDVSAPLMQSFISKDVSAPLMQSVMSNDVLDVTAKPINELTSRTAVACAVEADRW